MLSPKLLLLGAFVAFAAAFTVPPGTPSGMYEHKIADSGKETMQAVNGSALAIRSFSDTPTRRLRFEKRD